MAGQVKITINDREWLASLASNYWELTQGLGGIPGMVGSTGMLFDLGFEQHVTVTTEAMFFPLDIALLNGDLAVTEVYRDVQPGHVVHSTFPARYFLEVNASELENIQEGDMVSVEVMAPAQTTSPDWVTVLVSLVSAVGVGVLAVGMAKDLAMSILEEPGLAGGSFFIGQSGGGVLK